MNPWLFEQILGGPIRFAADQTQNHFVGMGSIIERANAKSTVLGSGILSRENKKLDPKTKLIAVRGDLTAEFAECSGQILLGDPLVLLDRFMTAPSVKSTKIGIVPHVRSFDSFKRKFGTKFMVIDPALPPNQVLEKIGACERVASQSLHGLIAADALGIANIWLEPSSMMVGGEFKFYDYFSTLAQPKPIVTLEDFENTALNDLPFSTGLYRYDKKTLFTTIRDELRSYAEQNPA